MTHPQQTPPGWYPDSAGGMRWWDGVQWTAAAPVGLAPTAAPVAYPTQYPRVPAGTPVYTRWIWWVVLLPVVVMVPTIGYLIDMQSRMLELVRWMVSVLPADGRTDLSFVVELMSRVLSLVFTPGYGVMLLISLSVTALTIVFAYFDHRDLERLGYARPFHWAWSFLALAGYGVVYVIGRSVVVRRRSGHGIAPMWVSIALIVASFVFMTVWMLWFQVVFMQQVMDIVVRSSV